MPFDNGHALIIGVGSYQHIPGANVPITVADAKAVAALLQDPHRCGYRPERVTLLHDQAAGREAIGAALQRLAETTGPEDTVLLFYAGHGEYGSDGDYYLTTYDTETEAGKVKAGTGLSEGELLARLRDIPAKRLLLIFNACHSGQISPALSLGDEPSVFGSLSLPQDTGEALLSTGEGRIIITACRPEQKSYIGPGPLTYFAQALTDGLAGNGVANSRGYISAYNLYEQLYFTVSETVAGETNQTQEPMLTVLQGVGPFAVSLYKGATSLGLFDQTEPLPPETATHQVSPQRSQRMLRQKIQNYQASIGGSGAIAQGDNAKAANASQGGVAVTGDVQGNVVTGPQNLAPKYNIDAPGSQIGAVGDNVRIEGGMHFGGPVQAKNYVAGDVHGDVVGGDKIGGDKVGGDKIERQTVFNQSGQKVGTQYNVGGDMSLSTGSGAALPQPQRQILLWLAEAPQENGNDEQIAEALNLPEADVKMHLGLLKNAGLVHLTSVFGGPLVKLTDRGRYTAQQLRSQR